MTDTAAGHYRPELQGLRALAVTLVVLEHAGVRWLPGGFVGVDVFFVLSGYLITGVLVREHAATGRIAYGAFLARRLRRLGPGLAVMLVMTALAAGVLLTPAELVRRTASLPYAAAWVSNFWFALADKDYFAPAAGVDLFLHTWSLGVEEQFYLR